MRSRFFRSKIITDLVIQEKAFVKMILYANYNLFFNYINLFDNFSWVHGVFTELYTMKTKHFGDKRSVYLYI